MYNAQIDSMERHTMIFDRIKVCGVRTEKRKGYPVSVPSGRRAWQWSLLLLLLLAGCSSGSTPSSPTKPSSSPASSTSTATASGSPVQSQEKIGAVFLQVLTIYSTQGLDPARKYATD